MISLRSMFWRKSSGEAEDALLLLEAADILKKQSDLLKCAAKQIDEWQMLALNSQRSTRELAIAFRLAQESPEIDIRDNLDALIRDISDSIASLEEHLVAE